MMWTGGPNNLVQRVNFHHGTSGTRLDGGTTIDSCYYHDMVMGQPIKRADGKTITDAHSSCTMVTKGSNIVIRNTHYVGGNTACFFIQRDTQNPTTSTVGSASWDHCLFEPGSVNGQEASFGVDVEDKKGTNGPFSLTNCVFGKGWTVGPAQLPKGFTASGNTYTDGSPVKVMTSDPSNG